VKCTSYLFLKSWARLPSIILRRPKDVTKEVMGKDAVTRGITIAPREVIVAGRENATVLRKVRLAQMKQT
jgi:hypothetical protein